MSICAMKELTLAVHRSRKEALLKELMTRGCVELKELEPEMAGLQLQRSGDAERQDLKALESACTGALAVLDREAPEKKKLLSAKPALAAEAFLTEDALKKAESLSGQILKYEEGLRGLAAREAQLKNRRQQLLPWLKLDIALNHRSTEYAQLQLGSLPAQTDLEAVVKDLSGIAEEAELNEMSRDKRQCYISLLTFKENAAAAAELLRGYGYAASPLEELDRRADEALRETEAALEALQTEREALREQIRALAGEREPLRLALEQCGAALELAEAEELLGRSREAVYFKGWIPASEQASLEKVFAEHECAWECREPEPEEYPEVPVRLDNNAVTGGLNMVTNMYSLPQYGTVDPNPLMAPFFILFYGLMMADIGYGIIMVLAALVVKKKMKPREGTLSFTQLLLWCGLSTICMGALTGGFFSDIPYQLVHLINPASTWKGLPYLFSPVNDSETVLYGSLVLGVLHLNTGMLVNFLQKKKAGHLADGLWEEGTLWLLLVTAILAFFKIGNVGGVPVPVLIAAVLLLIGAGRGKKGFGKVTAAVACIYNTATGWLGDVLSYARIMALMLAGGVVGQVFNEVAVMPAQSKGLNPFTVIVFILIFLAGHAMNFGLNILGCYVHDLRLQCLEFFGKFYQDGGRPFKPLRLTGKYHRVEE